MLLFGRELRNQEPGLGKMVDTHCRPWVLNNLGSLLTDLLFVSLPLLNQKVAVTELSFTG